MMGKPDQSPAAPTIPVVVFADSSTKDCNVIGCLSMLLYHTSEPLGT